MTEKFFSSAKLALAMMVPLLVSSCMEVVLPTGINDLYNAKASYCSMSIHGTVKDTQGRPLNNIRVIVIGRYFDDNYITYGRNYFPLDTIETNAYGVFEFDNSRVSPPFANIQINASDPGGIFLPDSIILRNVNYTGGNNEAFAGTAEINVPELILKKRIQ